MQHGTNSVRERNPTSARSENPVVLEFPDRSENSLSKGPRENARWVQPQHAREAVDALADCRRVRKELRAFGRVPKRRAHLVCTLSNDTLRIDREPSLPRVQKHVVMVEVP